MRRDPVQDLTQVICREMRRRAAVEPVIGHLKDDHRMRRNHLKGPRRRPHQRGSRCRWLQFKPTITLVQKLIGHPVAAWRPASPKIAHKNILHARLTIDATRAALNEPLVSAVFLSAFSRALRVADAFASFIADIPSTDSAL